jgi:hypothetical protein
MAAAIEAATPRRLCATEITSRSHDTRASSGEFDVSPISAFAVSSSKFVRSRASSNASRVGKWRYRVPSGRERIIASLKKLRRFREHLRLPRTFARSAKKALISIVKLGKDRQERIQQATRALINFAKESLKAVPAALKRGRRRTTSSEQKQIEKLQEQLKRDATLLQRVIQQAEARLEGKHIENKVYSLHEPAVTCIAKGKRSKPNEYGSKVSISVDRNGFVVRTSYRASQRFTFRLVVLQKSSARWMLMWTRVPYLKGQEVRKIRNETIP